MAGDVDKRRFRETDQRDPMEAMLAKWTEKLTKKMDTFIHHMQVSFQIGKGSGTTHHLPGHDATQHMASHTPTRPTMPTFLDEDIGAGAQREPETDPDQMDAYIAEYLARGPAIRDLISFRDYVQLRHDN